MIKIGRRETEDLLGESRYVARLLESLVIRLETYTELLEVELECRDPASDENSVGTNGTTPH